MVVRRKLPIHNVALESSPKAPKLPVSEIMERSKQTFCRGARVVLYRRLLLVGFGGAGLLLLFLVVVSNHREPEIHRQEWYFPRWPGINDRKNEGSSSSVALMPTIKDALEGKLSPNDVHLTAFHRVYVVRNGSLWMAPVPHVQSQMIHDRARFSETTLARAVRKRSHALVFVINYADSRFCCNDRLPILTMSAPLHHCDYTFPFPNYETIIRARKKVQFAYWGTYLWWQYPWRTRQRKAVWRGSPTGHEDGAEIESIPRVQLCRMAPQNANLLDAKLVGSTETFPILNTLASLTGEKMGVRDFQSYRAVLDIDGNSWSSRFGMLLCYSAVVLKVQPAHVDYFYNELIPDVHYISVSGDLHDLLDKIRFAVADENAPKVKQIIRNANLWCAKRMQLNVIERDMEWILDQYDFVSSTVTDIEISSLLDQYDFHEIELE